MKLTLPHVYRFTLLCFLAGIASISVTSCAHHDKDEEGLPPKYKPRPPRDPVEQRIFYDGWPKIF
jgi:hypothetical protein